MRVIVSDRAVRSGSWRGSARRRILQL